MRTLNKKTGRTLAWRISVSFIPVVSAAFVLVLLFTFYSTFRILNREYSSRLTQQLGSLADELDLTINNVYQIHESVQNDQKLKDSIQAWYDRSEKKQPVRYESENLNRVRGISTLLNCIYLYDVNAGEISYYDNNLHNEDFRRQIQEKVESFAAERAYRSFVKVGDSVIFLCSLYEKGYRYNAYIAMEINQNRLFFRCYRSAENIFPDIHLTDGISWVSELGEPLEDSPKVVEGTGRVQRENRSYLVFAYGSNLYPGWTLVGLYDRSILLRDILRQIFPLLIIFFITILAVIAISGLNARRVTRPIEKLSDSMQLVEQGEYPPPLSVRQEDEVGMLLEGYNHMVSALKTLHDNLLEEQNEKRKIEVASLNTRLKLLQSQINPHFIYNTLNTMNYMAAEVGNQELASLIYSFSSLLRSSISVDSDFVSVRTEINSVRYYMEIQARRYADTKVSCVYAVDPEAENLLLPRMILQPLVENSLIHGILPAESAEGTIRIRCSLRDGHLFVHISDNGIGIPPEKLDKLRRGELKISNGYNHIGLNNVRERLTILYQEECCFQMMSDEGRGTVISFRVPARNNSNV